VISLSTKERPSRQTRKLALALIGLAGLGGIGWMWSQSLQTRLELDRAAARGKSALARVEHHADAGRAHLSPDALLSYKSSPPTSGPHAMAVLTPGFYKSSQPPALIVHALEHGNVVIYYETLSEQARRMILDLTDRYDGRWDGIIAVPQSGLGDGFVLTAWRRALRLPSFDRDVVAAFVDAYRGRGPEKSVR
jgi:hypothetical protein